MAKEVKTNAMRILDKNKISYSYKIYECDEFIDGVTVANKLNQPVEQTFKTLVTVAKNNEHYVFLVPVAEELDMKAAAKAVGEKSVEMIAVKDIKNITGYIRGGCSPIGMKKKYPTYIDASAVNYDKITVSSGTRGMQLLLDPNTLIKFTGATLCSVTVKIEK